MKKILSLLLLAGATTLGVCINSNFKQLKANDQNAPQDLFEMTNAEFAGTCDYQPGVQSLYCNTGLIFDFATLPCTVKYRNVVNLNEVNDTLVEFTANMDCLYEAELTNIKITVTDAYDPNLFICMNRKINPDYLANIDDPGVRNDFVTVEYNNIETAYPNTTYSSLQSTVVAYKSCLFPFPGKDYYPVNMGFDVSTNEVFTYGCGQYNHKDKTIVYDLDDPTDTIPDFPGWTTGEVYVSISTVSSTGQIVVGKVGNDTFDNVDDTYFQKDTGSLLLGKKSASKTLFTGVVNHHYPLPTFQNGVTGNVEIKVSGQPVDCSDYTTFVPKKAGNYTATYSSTNYFNETISKIFRFSVVDAIIPVVDETPKIDSFKIFDIAVVPTFKFSGGHGELDKTIYFVTDDVLKEVHTGDNVSIKKKYKNVSYRVDIVDELEQTYSFDYPLSIDYKVLYFSLIDCFDTVTVNQGNKFIIPDFVAIDYSKYSVDSTNIDVTITSGITRAFAPLEEIIVNADMNIEYTYKDQILKTLVVKCAPTNVKPDDDNYYFEKHMNSMEGINSVSIRDIGTVFSLKEGDVSITMPYILSSTNLGLTMNIVRNKNSFSSVDIKYESLSGEYILANFTNEADKSALTVNGKPSPHTIYSGSSIYSVSDDLKIKGETYYSYGLFLDSPSASIQNENQATIVDLDKWASGFEFDGFARGGARVTFTIHGASDGDMFIVSSISNQIMTSNALTFGDVTAPCLTFDKVMLASTIVDIGSSFIVPKCNAYDVLDNNVSISMSITDPEGNYILKDAESQDYYLLFDKYGTYVVSYTAVDSKGNRKSYRYNFMILDKEAPNVTIVGDYYETYISSVTVLDYQVNDNLGADGVEVTIFLVDKDLRRKVVNVGDVLELASGEYSLVYMAIDENGNSSSLYYTFNVKAGK